MRKEKALIEIRIAGLMQGSHTFDFTCRTEDFMDKGLNDAVFSRDISVQVIAEKTENEITVIIRTATTADVTCDICLAPLERELTGEYRIDYLFDTEPENPENSDEDYRMIDRNAISIDLTEDVRETLLLSVPMKVTCTDNPDCRLFVGNTEPDDTPENENSSWQDSLEKLKNKYR